MDIVLTDESPTTYQLELFEEHVGHPIYQTGGPVRSGGWRITGFIRQESGLYITTLERVVENIVVHTITLYVTFGEEEVLLSLPATPL